MKPEVLLLCSLHPTYVPLLSQMNPVHALLSYFISIFTLFCHPSLGFPSTSFKWDYPAKTLHTIFFILSLHMSHSSQNWFDQPTNIWWGLQVLKLLIVQCFPSFYGYLTLRSNYSLAPYYGAYSACVLPWTWETKTCFKLPT